MEQYPPKVYPDIPQGDPFSMTIERHLNTTAMMNLTGKMNRLRSEIIIMSKCLLDLADQQTLKDQAELLARTSKIVVANLAATQRLVNRAKAKKPAK